MCLPVQDYEAVAKPVRRVSASRHVCADTESPAERAPDAHSDAFTPRSTDVAREDRL